MPNYDAPTGTLIVAALLVLAIVFAGNWITAYVTEGNPWALLPWFGLAATVIIVLGVFIIFWSRRR